MGSAAEAPVPSDLQLFTHTHRPQSSLKYIYIFIDDYIDVYL